MQLDIPDPSLVLLVGPAGAGKTTFAGRHFTPTQVLSSDALRAAIADDETNQAATAEAFSVLNYLAAARLRRRRLTVIDATNVVRSGRKRLLQLAVRYRVPAVAIVFDIPEATAQRWNARRPGRRVGPEIVSRQHQLMRRALPGLAEEGFFGIYVLSGEDELSSAIVHRQAAPTRSRASRSS